MLTRRSSGAGSSRAVSLPAARPTVARQHAVSAATLARARAGRQTRKDVDWAAAFKMLDEGKSLALVGVHFGIAKTTLHDRWHRRGSVPAAVGRPTALPTTVELALSELTRAAGAAAYGYTLKDIQNTAVKMAAEMGNTTFVASDMWLARFKRRHGLAAKSGEPISVSRLTGLTRVTANGFYDNMEAALAEFERMTGRAAGPADLANADETGFKADVIGGRKVLVAKDQRAVYFPSKSSIGHVTLVYCGKADGTIMPPVLIMEGERPLAKYLNGTNGAFRLAMEAKGWMTTDIFIDWLHHYAAWMNGPSILVLDWHSSRNPLLTSYYARKLGIIVVMLPPNCTHRLQPADVAVFRPLKQRFGDVLQRTIPRVTVTKDNIASFIYQAITAPAATCGDAAAVGVPGVLYSKNWTAGFKACGIYPLNRNALRDEDFAPSDAFLSQLSDAKTAAALLELAGPKPTPTPSEAWAMVEEALPPINLVDLDARAEKFVGRTYVKKSMILTQPEMLERELAVAKAKEEEENKKRAKKLESAKNKEQKAKEAAEKKAKWEELQAARKQKKALELKQKEERAAAIAKVRAEKAAAKEAVPPAKAGVVAAKVQAAAPVQTAAAGTGRKRKAVDLEEFDTTDNSRVGKKKAARV